MLSPQKAADLAGVSRKTILDHIKSMKLHAIRDNRNRWQISEEDFEAWLKSRSRAKKPDTTTEPPLVVSPKSNSEGIELAVTRKELEMLRFQLSEKTQRADQLQSTLDGLQAELRTERQRAAQERKQLIDAITEAQRPRTLIERVFGKKD